MVKEYLRRCRNYARSIALRGSRYHCPLCDRGYRRLVMGGCPGCGSMDRHRILWLYLQHMQRTARIRFAGRLLHVSPEASLGKILPQRFDEYLSVDIDPRYAMQVADITNMPDIADNSFDGIVCNHVLEHVDNDRNAMSELFRVLKPGGWASLHVPIAGNVPTDEDPSVIDPQERLRRFGQEDHVRLYGWDYLDRLRTAGFNVEVTTWEKFMSRADAERFAAIEDEVILGWKPND